MLQMRVLNAACRAARAGRRQVLLRAVGEAKEGEGGRGRRLGAVGAGAAAHSETLQEFCVGLN